MNKSVQFRLAANKGYFADEYYVATFRSWKVQAMTPDGFLGYRSSCALSLEPMNNYHLSKARQYEEMLANEIKKKG